MSNLTTLSNDQLLEKTTDWVTSHLNFCGCGAPEWLTYYLYKYLDRIDRSKENEDIDQNSYRYKYDLILYAYICDSAGWTDHGGSINYCWLTDNGKELLKKLRRIDWSEFKKIEEENV